MAVNTGLGVSLPPRSGRIADDDSVHQQNGTSHNAGHVYDRGGGPGSLDDYGQHRTSSAASDINHAELRDGDSQERDEDSLDFARRLIRPHYGVRTATSPAIEQGHRLVAAASPASPTSPSTNKLGSASGHARTHSRTSSTASLDDAYTAASIHNGSATRRKLVRKESSGRSEERKALRKLVAMYEDMSLRLDASLHRESELETSLKIARSNLVLAENHAEQLEDTIKRNSLAMARLSSASTHASSPVPPPVASGSGSHLHRTTSRSPNLSAIAAGNANLHPTVRESDTDTESVVQSPRLGGFWRRRPAAAAAPAAASSSSPNPGEPSFTSTVVSSLGRSIKGKGRDVRNSYDGSSEGEEGLLRKPSIGMLRSSSATDSQKSGGAMSSEREKSLLSKIDGLQKQSTLLQEAYDSLEAEHDSLKSTHEGTCRKYASLQEEIENLSVSLFEEANTMVAEERKVNTFLNEQLDKAKQEIESLQKELDDLREAHARSLLSSQPYPRLSANTVSSASSPRMSPEHSLNASYRLQRRRSTSSSIDVTKRSRRRSSIHAIDLIENVVAASSPTTRRASGGMAAAAAAVRALAHREGEDAGSGSAGSHPSARSLSISERVGAAQRAGSPLSRKASISTMASERSGLPSAHSSKPSFDGQRHPAWYASSKEEDARSPLDPTEAHEIESAVEPMSLKQKWFSFGSRKRTGQADSVPMAPDENGTSRDLEPSSLFQATRAPSKGGQYQHQLHAAPPLSASSADDAMPLSPVPPSPVSPLVGSYTPRSTASGTHRASPSPQLPPRQRSAARPRATSSSSRTFDPDETMRASSNLQAVLGSSLSADESPSSPVAGLPPAPPDSATNSLAGAHDQPQETLQARQSPPLVSHTSNRGASSSTNAAIDNLLSQRDRFFKKSPTIPQVPSPEEPADKRDSLDQMPGDNDASFAFSPNKEVNDFLDQVAQDGGNNLTYFTLPRQMNTFESLSPGSRERSATDDASPTLGERTPSANGNEKSSLRTRNAAWNNKGGAGSQGTWYSSGDRQDRHSPNGDLETRSARPGTSSSVRSREGENGRASEHVQQQWERSPPQDPSSQSSSVHSSAGRPSLRKAGSSSSSTARSYNQSFTSTHGDLRPTMGSRSASAASMRSTRSTEGRYNPESSPAVSTSSVNTLRSKQAIPTLRTDTTGVASTTSLSPTKAVFSANPRSPTDSLMSSMPSFKRFPSNSSFRTALESPALEVPPSSLPFGASGSSPISNRRLAPLNRSDSLTSNASFSSMNAYLDRAGSISSSGSGSGLARHNSGISGSGSLAEDLDTLLKSIDAINESLGLEQEDTQASSLHSAS